MNEGRPELYAELPGHVLKDDCGNIRDTTKSTDGLKYLQLHEQPKFGLPVCELPWVPKFARRNSD
jgi:hypothetical protein